MMLRYGMSSCTSSLAGTQIIERAWRSLENDWWPQHVNATSKVAGHTLMSDDVKAMVNQWVFRQSLGPIIGRGLLWFLICFPQLEMEVEVFSGRRQAVMGKCKGPYAMHRGGFRRARPHFPLPLVNGALLKLGATVEEFVRPHFAGMDVVQIWTALSVMALNAVAGHGRAILEKNPNKSQRAALGAIAASVNRVLLYELRS